MHDQFIDSIDLRVQIKSGVACQLENWSQCHADDDVARYLDGHLDTARMVSRIWKPFHEWIRTVFDESMRYRLEPRELSVVTLQQRDKKGSATILKLLWALDEGEMQEGIKGVQNFQTGLQKQWKMDGQVRRRKLETDHGREC